MITVRFFALTGKLRCTHTQDFATPAWALVAVRAHAETKGFRDVRALPDEDGWTIRYTATTPGGRRGRNIAMGEYDAY